MTNQSALLSLLEERFHAHPHRHPNVAWDKILKLLKEAPDKLKALSKMEETGGEPDLIVYSDQALKDTQYLYVDFSKETPKGRRSICYDKASREKRKKFPPKSSVEEMADLLGIQLVDENIYRYIQSLENLDLKTSTWLKTPDKIRALGGAIFADYRYDTIFIYHNSAESYYKSRGFRGYVTL